MKPYFTTNVNSPFQASPRFGVPNQVRPSNSHFNYGNYQAPQFKFGVPHTGFRPQTQQQNFKFGIPNQGQKFGAPQGYRPNFGNTPQGYRPNFGNAHQGYRPNFIQAPNQFRQSFNQSPANQFKFGIAGQQLPVSTDVTMRTALPAPRHNQAFHNEIEVIPENNNECYDVGNDVGNDIGNDVNYNYDFNYDKHLNAMALTETYYDPEAVNDENFYKLASETILPKY